MEMQPIEYTSEAIRTILNLQWIFEFEKRLDNTELLSTWRGCCFRNIEYIHISVEMCQNCAHLADLDIPPWMCEPGIKRIKKESGDKLNCQTCVLAVSNLSCRMLCICYRGNLLTASFILSLSISSIKKYIWKGDDEICTRHI